MRGLHAAWRDLGIVARAVWRNLALLAGLVLAAALVLRISGSYPKAGFLDLLVDSFHMVHLEAVTEAGDGVVPQMLTFLVPALGLIVVGEGVLRVAAVYLHRDEHREEWDTMVAETFAGHTVICGAGEMGRAVLRLLLMRDPDAQVVLIDKRPGVLDELGLQSTNVCRLKADMTYQTALQAAHCQAAALVILASGDDATNLEAGSKALQLNPQAQIWIRLYHSGLASLMDLSTKPNVHFFCPYERAAEALVQNIHS